MKLNFESKRQTKTTNLIQQRYNKDQLYLDLRIVVATQMGIGTIGWMSSCGETGLIFAFWC